MLLSTITIVDFDTRDQFSRFQEVMSLTSSLEVFKKVKKKKKSLCHMLKLRLIWLNKGKGPISNPLGKVTVLKPVAARTQTLAGVAQVADCTNHRGFPAPPAATLPSLPAGALSWNCWALQLPRCSQTAARSLLGIWRADARHRRHAEFRTDQQRQIPGFDNHTDHHPKPSPKPNLRSSHLKYSRLGFPSQKFQNLLLPFSR